MEKKFRLKADFEFWADNVDDALKKLSKHFMRISEGGESNLISKGEVDLMPEKTPGKTGKKEPKWTT